MATPQIRVIADWNNDAFFEPTFGSEPLNLIPTPLSYASIDAVAASTATFTKSAELTDYGIQKYTVVTGTNTTAGIRWGSDGTTIDDIPISASTTYRVSLWVKGIASYSGVSFQLNVHDQSGNFIAQTFYTLTASWAKQTFTFTTGVGDTYLRIDMLKNTNATNVTFDAAGLMLTTGTTTVNSYNTGQAYSRYEDISADVMDAQWSYRMDTGTHIPREGTLSLVLDNSTRKYSPRYASSVLYGAFRYGLRIRIDVKRTSDSTWVTMWCGWITGYDPTPGKTVGNKQARITATQGMFNLDAVPMQDSLQEDVTFDEVLPNILYSGWYPAITPYVFVADVSLADENAWTPDIDDFVTTFDTGITEFPLVGDGWSDTDTYASKALRDLMEVEQGWLYLTRDGRMNFKSRESVMWDAAVDYTVNLNSQARPLKYTFGPGEINSVNLTYFPSGETDNQILWQRRGTKLCRARDSRRVDAKFEYEEGQKITVKSINAFGDGGNDSTLSATIAGGDVYDTRYYYATVDLRNGKGVITIYNQGPVDAFFSITLKGTIEINADSEQIQVTADNAVNLRDVRIRNRLLKDEDMAADLGNYIIARHSDDYDEFESFEVVSRDATWLDRILNIDAGAIVSLSEYQTAVDSKKHLVTGAEHSWRPGELRSTFLTTRVDETEYWILGTSELSHETVMAY